MGATPILSHFSPILAISKIFTSVLTFLGEQNFFLQKCPKSGLVSQKNYFEFFVTLGGGVKPDVTFVTFFFLKVSLRHHISNKKKNFPQGAEPEWKNSHFFLTIPFQWDGTLNILMHKNLSSSNKPLKCWFFMLMA